ncbi:unnamed protein product [Allacma fusca]|uniref:Ig-like domain-containing protein n=1 Tax=Allacma fusca TaxID=39272 RepID=A0A8J2LEU0_9HEXA|nr:unnamed protein product [Allacma fusca]
MEGDWKRSWVLLIFSCLTVLTEGKELDVSSSLGVTQGVEIFALGCPGVLPNFDSVIWLLHEENVLVGAGVNYNNQKYRYHASTGELAIRNVDYTDSGIYRCIVTYGQGDNTIDLRREAQAVELRGNLIRGLLISGLALSLLVAACAVYKYRWREPKYMKYSEELQLVSGLDNLGMDVEHQRKYGRRKSSSASSNVGVEPPPTTSTAAVHITHI